MSNVQRVYVCGLSEDEKTRLTFYTSNNFTMKKGMSCVTKQYLLESKWSLVLSQSIDVVVLGQSGSN